MNAWQKIITKFQWKPTEARKELQANFFLTTDAIRSRNSCRQYAKSIFPLFSRSCASLCMLVAWWGEWVLWKSASSIWGRINHSPARAGSPCQHSCTEKWAAGEILQLVYAEYRTPRPWTFSPSWVSSCTPPPFLPSLPWAPGRGSKIYTALPLKCWLSMFTGIVYTEN